tara:strand:- start:89 stop:511 length:423 start_codon:yes stop_codon:yes gene_type:complete
MTNIEHISTLDNFFNQRTAISELCYDVRDYRKVIDTNELYITKRWVPQMCFHPKTNIKRISDYEAWNLIGDHILGSYEKEWELKKPIKNNLNAPYHAFQSIIKNERDNKKDIYIKIRIKENVPYIDGTSGLRLYGISFHD